MTYHESKPYNREPAVDEKHFSNEHGMGLSEDYLEEFLEETIMDPQFFIF